jgi:iron complex transport system permease protein
MFVIAAFALTRGPIDISFDELIHVLTGGGSNSVRLVVLEWRLPRIVTALVMGAALGVAGALIQGITRNALGSPDIIGFSAGSYFGVLVAVVVLQLPAAAQSAAAIGGGLLAAGIIWLLAFRGGTSGFRLILVGIGVSSILTGLSSWLILMSSQSQYRTFVYWGAGSLDAVTWDRVGGLLIAAAVTITLVFCLSRPLRQFELGDSVARSQGVRLERVRGLALALGILLTALVTAAVGPVEFVALAAPHIARRIRASTGPGIASSAAVGALIVLVADLVGDELLPVGLPVGVVTLIFGGIYLTFLLLHESRRP